MSVVNKGSGTPTGGGRSIYKAVVVDVYVPGMQMSKAMPIIGSEKLINAPDNTCIVKLYDAATVPADGIVAFPFFPPHLQVPIKPGEIVWVISPTIDAPQPSECFWVCKIETGGLSSDINFSHPFRNLNLSTTRGSSAMQAKVAADAGQPINDEAPRPPGFLNNVSQKQNIQSDFGDSIFSEINASAGSLDLVHLEPIPKFSKRPGDLILQGSNNALISLGQDRGFPITDFDNLLALSGSSSKMKPMSGSGTVDIVSGRSRYIPPSDPGFYTNIVGAPGASDEADQVIPRTAFSTVKNTRGYAELNKEFQSLAGGDVDFAVDASRVYVSMKTDGDYNFALLNTLTGSVARMPASIVSGSIQPASGSAYVIAKSDEVRIIARKQLKDEYYPNIGNPEINGSIKIIKEGTKDGDLAAVVLQPDGSIQISGSRIFLGRHPEDGGLEESEAGPEDAIHVQPYVRYQQLEDLLNAIMDNIDAFCDTLNTHVTPGYGNPSPQILDAAAALKSDIASRREEIVSLKSERIFGE